MISYCLKIFHYRTGLISDCGPLLAATDGRDDGQLVAGPQHHLGLRVQVGLVVREDEGAAEPLEDGVDRDDVGHEVRDAGHGGGDSEGHGGGGEQLPGLGEQEEGDGDVVLAWVRHLACLQVGGFN